MELRQKAKLYQQRSMGTYFSTEYFDELERQLAQWETCSSSSGSEDICNPRDVDRTSMSSTRATRGSVSSDTSSMTSTTTTSYDDQEHANYQPASYPPTSYPPTSYPPTSYPPTSYPPGQPRTAWSTAPARQPVQPSAPQQPTVYGQRPGGPPQPTFQPPTPPPLPPELQRPVRRPAGAGGVPRHTQYPVSRVPQQTQYIRDSTQQPVRTSATRLAPQAPAQPQATQGLHQQVRVSPSRLDGRIATPDSQHTHEYHTRHHLDRTTPAAGALLASPQRRQHRYSGQPGQTTQATSRPQAPQQKHRGASVPATGQPAPARAAWTGQQSVPTQAQTYSRNPARGVPLSSAVSNAAKATSSTHHLGGTRTVYPQRGPIPASTYTGNPTQPVTRFSVPSGGLQRSESLDSLVSLSSQGSASANQLLKRTRQHQEKFLRHTQPATVPVH